MAVSSIPPLTNLEALKRWFNQLYKDSNPVGTVRLWAGGAAIPYGYFLCDGQDISQRQYPTLFAVIGTTYGSGGAGLFKVPSEAATAAGLDYIIKW